MASFSIIHALLSRAQHVSSVSSLSSVSFVQLSCDVIEGDLLISRTLFDKILCSFSYGIPFCMFMSAILFPMCIVCVSAILKSESSDACKCSLIPRDLTCIWNETNKEMELKEISKVLAHLSLERGHEDLPGFFPHITLLNFVVSGCARIIQSRKALYDKVSGYILHTLVFKTNIF